MKLILAIVSNDDSGAVSSALTRGGFSVTKLATTGGFLMAGNTTFISGVEDEKVDEVIGIIAKHSRRRTQVVPSTSTMDVGMYSSFPPRLFSAINTAARPYRSSSTPKPMQTRKAPRIRRQKARRIAPNRAKKPNAPLPGKNHARATPACTAP